MPTHDHYFYTFLVELAAGLAASSAWLRPCLAAPGQCSISRVAGDFPRGRRDPESNADARPSALSGAQGRRRHRRRRRSPPSPPLSLSRRLPP